MLNWLFKRVGLTSHLLKEKRITIKGCGFTIKKIDALSYAQGLMAMQSIFSTGTTQITGHKETAEKKLRQHYRDTFLSGVVSPRLTTKENDLDGVFVDLIFNDPEIMETLYKEIVEFTYGKKKLKLK